MAYGTNKAALIHLTKQQTVGPWNCGIRVNAIAPGPVETDMAKLVHYFDIRASYQDAIPLARYGSIHEIALMPFYFCAVMGHVYQWMNLVRRWWLWRSGELDWPVCDPPGENGFCSISLTAKPHRTLWHANAVRPYSIHQSGYLQLVPGNLMGRSVDFRITEIPIWSVPARNALLLHTQSFHTIPQQLLGITETLWPDGSQERRRIIPLDKTVEWQIPIY